MADTTAPAGWYGQPDGTERFWTGEGWSDQVRPLVARPTPRQPAQVHAPAQGLVRVQPAPIGALAAPQLAYTEQGYVPVTQVAPKSPGLALLGSFVVPGLGQLMNGQVGKGLLLFLAYLVSIVLMLVVIGFFTAFAVWVWAMVDAYGGAQQWNARHGILS
jgi:TM2 domain-containing membrane protein YozV